MKTNLSRSAKFAVAVAAQILIVAGLIVFNASLLARGTEIILPIEPVDPRDPLRGDYVTIEYDISKMEIPVDVMKKNVFKTNDIVYVVLEKDGNHWTWVSAQKNKPAGGMFIKGNVKYSYSYNYGKAKNDTGTLYVEYGIEDYFIPEGSGANLGQEMRNKNAFARVVVGENGNAILKDIFFEKK